MDSNDLLRDLLRDVSRSFYLTLGLLPRSVRPQIGLAYLLARATDTIADTVLVPRAQRLTTLHRLRDRILAQSTLPLDLTPYLADLTTPSTTGECRLLSRIEEAIALLARFSKTDVLHLRNVLSTITSGQILDLERFEVPGPIASETTLPTRIQALATLDELDDYTYRVAGCVGEFWTRICREHLFPRAAIPEETLLAAGVRFGKGLQLVNILRDLPRDLRQGRCYVPAELLAPMRLEPVELLDPSNWPRLRPTYLELARVASGHLEAGWEYTCLLPRTQVRLRIACALPALIGARTLALLRHSNPLDAEHRIKVTRREVSGIFRRAVLRYPFLRSWERQFAEAQTR